MNIRQKGQQGERDVQKMLNNIIKIVHTERNLPQYEPRDELFQRNQNQSAVGGSDLSCPFPLEIEVKRQEQLSINTWWKQTIESSNRTGGIPILIFKQNRKKWRIIMLGNIALQPHEPNVTIEVQKQYRELSGIRVEINQEQFEQWFKAYYRLWLDNKNY